MKYLRACVGSLLVSSVLVMGIPFGHRSTAAPCENVVSDDAVCVTVVGAGPAGVAIVGMLLEVGIAPAHIRWVDPAFNVGRMGEFYYNVPGNALAENYIEFVNACTAFRACSSEALTYLRTSYPYECCKLHVIIDALRDITADLRTKIKCHAAVVQSLQFRDELWHIALSTGEVFTSMNVVLATGSHPRTLNYPCAKHIPLDDALDKTRLSSYLEPEDTIALVGGSHSGMLVLKHLHELSAKRIINFYLDPITYAYDMGNGNVPDYNGLKCDVAEWAFEVLEKQQPECIVRLKNTEAAREAWLPLCNKIIYAVGFKRNELPLLDISSQDLVYDDTTGYIMPRLFGIGIAFPEKIVDEWGKTQHTVGMIDFLTYAQRIVPTWISKKNKRGLRSVARFADVLRMQLIPGVMGSE